MADEEIIETVLSQYPGKGTVMERLWVAIEDDKEWVTAKLEQALWPSMRPE